MNSLEYLKNITKEKDEALLVSLIERAEAFVLSYTGRTKLITQLDYAVRDLAVICYNRLGTEGESSRSEAGESYSFENAPKSVYDILNRYRLARVGGKTYENKAGQD